MVQRNKNIAKLHSDYLFDEILARTNTFHKKNPSAKIINLGIGDTTKPLPEPVVNTLKGFVQQLGTEDGYRGYGTAQGSLRLRKKISEIIYDGRVSPDEIFISDGAKSDINKLQFFFGANMKMAVQNPTYPAYVNSGVISGHTGEYIKSKEQYDGITYMPCTPENNFFPDLESVPSVDLIYFCSPNNPTGNAATREQLTQLVAFAKKNRSIIIFDSAYASYIQGSDLPKSIFEIDGAREVAIEISSFSKLAGFTGIRLGWTIIPKELKFDDGTNIYQDWVRLENIVFNGASNIAQQGGIACLEHKSAIDDIINFYLENARILKTFLKSRGIECYGGEHAPYLWVHFPNQNSWDVFDHFLNQSHISTIPGAGFGSCGNDFIRLSSFGSREDIQEAIQRLEPIA